MKDMRAVGVRRAIAPTGVVKLSYAVACSARSGLPATSRKVVLSIKNSTNSWTAGEKRRPCFEIISSGRITTSSVNWIALRASFLIS